MTNSFWHKEQNQEYDHIIIGAGISGLSIAFHLRKERPNDKIAIIDKNHPFWGASGRNAGFLTLGSMNYCKSLLETSPYFLKTISENLKTLIPLVGDKDKHGSLSLAYSQEELDRYVETAKSLSEYASYEVLNQVKLKEIGLDAFGAVKYNNEGSVSPMNLAKYLMDNLGEKTHTHYGVSVHSVKDNEVVCDQGTFKGKEIYLATNIYSNNVSYPKKDKIKLTPARNQIMAVTCNNLDNLKNIVYSTKHFLYFKAHNNKLIIGGARKEDPTTENTMELGENSKILSYLKDFVNNELKGLEPTDDVVNWSGVMAYTHDDVPYVGTVDNNFHTLVGLNGHGMGASFRLAELLVKSIYQDEKIDDSVNVNRVLND